MSATKLSVEAIENIVYGSVTVLLAILGLWQGRKRIVQHIYPSHNRRREEQNVELGLMSRDTTSTEESVSDE